MDMILWRHAEAQPARDGQDDADRPLTPKGERQAERMAQWLDRRLAASTRVLVSPARRTRQTAEALGRAFETSAALAHDGGVDALLAAVRWPQAKEPVLVVGHQPTLGLTAARLVGGADAPWAMKKGAVWWLRRREDDHGEWQVMVQAVQAPDLL